MQGWRQFLDLLFPRSCQLCRRLVIQEQSASLCIRCREQLEPIYGGCRRCGAPLRQDGACAFCKDQRWEFGRAWSYTVYDSGAAKAVRLMKESHCESLTLSIGELLSQWLMADETFNPTVYDAIVPIPQHWVRRMAQRYNQASTLGERLARVTGLPVRETLLRRGRWTQKQGMKTISERRENLVGAFEVPKVEAVRYRSFLLIDDVMTSGATLQEAARVLRRAGARQVDAVVFARGVNASKAAAGIRPDIRVAVPLTFGQNTRESPRGDNEALRRKIH